jgi:hypothetical protein
VSSSYIDVKYINLISTSLENSNKITQTFGTFVVQYVVIHRRIKISDVVLFMKKLINTSIVVIIVIMVLVLISF